MSLSRSILRAMWTPRLLSQAAARQYSSILPASSMGPAAIVPALRQLGQHNTINTSMFAITPAARRWTLMRTMASGSDAQLIKVIGAEESFEQENYVQPEVHCGSGLLSNLVLSRELHSGFVNTPCAHAGPQNSPCWLDAGRNTRQHIDDPQQATGQGEHQGGTVGCIVGSCV